MVAGFAKDNVRLHHMTSKTSAVVVSYSLPCQCLLVLCYTDNFNLSQLKSATLYMVSWRPTVQFSSV